MRTEAARHLNSLLDPRSEVVAAVRDARNAADFASAGAQTASSELAKLEARRLGREPVTDAERRRAETKLAAARADASGPWAACIEAGRAALREIEAEIARHVTENYGELARELFEEADAIKTTPTTRYANSPSFTCSAKRWCHA